MKLLFIFDNYSNTYDWKTKINIVKRWILYNINYLLMKNNLEEVKIIKTYPKMYEFTFSCSLNLFDKNNIELSKFIELIKFIDDIIVKYDKYYKIESFLNCIDCVNNSNKDYDNIFILTSFSSFSDSDLLSNFKKKNKIQTLIEQKKATELWTGQKEEKIGEKINTIQKEIEEDTERIIIPESVKTFLENKIKINVLNFSPHSNMIIKNTFSKSYIQLLIDLSEKIKESTIEFTEFRKIYNNVNSIQKFINNNILKTKYDEYEIENILKTTKITNLNNLFLLNLQLVELNLLNKKQDYNNYYNILLTYIDRINSNFIKYCFNSVSNLILFEKGFILNKEFKINKFNKIFEFYKIIYPRLIKQNFFNIKNNNKKKLTNINNNFNISNIENNNQFSKINYSDEIDKSTIFLFSNTTLTNWIEEYNEHNVFGILLYYNIPKNTSFNIFNASDNILTDFPCTYVSNITNNFISMYDYYELFLAEINDSKNVLINNETGTITVNDFCITDNIFGNSNIFLPIYICKEHWDLCKIFWNYHISLSHNCVEGQYNKMMDNIYFFVLLKNFNEILRLKELIGYNNIKLFFYIIRTCMQICIDNKYSLSIEKNYSLSLDELLKSNSKELFEKNFNEFIIRSLQLILCSKYQNIQDDFNKIKNIYIKLLLDTKFSYLINKQKNDDGDNETNDQKEIENYLLPFLILENTIINLSIFIKNIFEIINFNKLLKYLDSKYGLVPDLYLKSPHFIEENLLELPCEKIAEILKNNIFSENYKINISNYFS